MRNTFDMTPFARSTIGFDRILDHLETLAEPSPGDNYPPYNIEKLSEDRYQVALAVAGFTDNELDVTVEANQLTVSGRKLIQKTGICCITALHTGPSSAGSAWPTLWWSRMPNCPTASSPSSWSGKCQKR